MKKLLVIVVALGLAMGASAQRFGHGGGFGRGGGHVYIAPPRVSVGVGFGYSPYYYSPFGYYPYGYGAFYGPAYSRPSKLGMKIQDIKNDYEDKIYSAKHDNTLTRKERRQTIHNLRAERDQEINDLKRNYYKN